MKNELIEKFKDRARLNGAKIVDFKEIEGKLRKLGYKNENYFIEDNIGIVKAISANAEEANVLIDTSDKEKLKSIIDIETLYIIIDSATIKESMFEAYKISPKTNYMVFIAAESKTADIEKQLVSGVQGAKEVIFLIK